MKDEAEKIQFQIRGLDHLTRNEALDFHDHNYYES